MKANTQSQEATTPVVAEATSRKMKAMDRAYAPEILKILNREGFTSNRGLYKRVREDTGVYESGNHNIISVMEALDEEGLLTMPEVPLEGLVRSSICAKFNVLEVTEEIKASLIKLGFTAHFDEDVKEEYFLRPWTGKIFSRYEIKAEKKVKAPKVDKEAKAKEATRIEKFVAKELAKRFKVKQLSKKHKETLAAEGFKAVKEEKFPFTTTYIREVAV